jgi:hypothetical protein
LKLFYYFSTNTPTKPLTVKKGFKVEGEQRTFFYRKMLGLKEHNPLSVKPLAKYLSSALLMTSAIPGITESINLRLFAANNYWTAGVSKEEDRLYVIHNLVYLGYRQENNIMHE